MEIGLVEKIDIDREMQQAYLDYAMSVIVARALPDARDGLKPVHRRILYAMYDMGLRPDSPYKKSARIVGEVLGKYHPHGDSAVYEAMARMAQDFSMRCLLVDGQGNFGSVDGDAPAAMRYTEARLTAPARDMLADIQKNTVSFSPNFDGTLSEPDVLPAALPNLLINGATGIAVGMSTSIPPHNLSEVVGALKYMLENWTKLDDIPVEDLMRFIQGPDFPTGGVIIQEAGGEDLQSAYGSGRGRVVVQARARLEEMERGRSRIIVTELPFMTNKASLIERIAELVREEKLEGIADLRDESDRQGMRIVIELNRAAEPEAVLRNLYKYTPMQSTFSIIMLALVEGEPRLLSLKAALRVYLDHRLEIVRRRSQYDLEKARQRAHVLEGLRVALKNLDEVIDLIRKAPDADVARERLMKRFKLTEIQAQAILDMQLRRLASLERKKIEQEYKEVLALIKELESLLRSPAKMRAVIADELEAVKVAFGDRRRTQIVHMKAGESRLSLLTATDLTPDKTVWVAVTPSGLISRSLEDGLPRQSGNEAPAWLVQASTRDTLYLVCERGEAAAVPVHSLPEKENPAEGTPFWKVSALQEVNSLTALFALPPKAERAEGWYVLTCTRQGMVKKSELGELPGPSANGFTLARVNEADRLGWLRLTHGQAEILLVTTSGMAIRFSEEEVRPMGLVAAGVTGLRLQNGDEVAGMEVLPQPGEIFLLASDGAAKRVPVKDFPRQGRYGQGVAAWKLPEKSRVAGLAIGKGSLKATVHLEKLAPKSIRLDDAPLQSRATRGRVLAELKGSPVQRLTVPWAMPRPAVGNKDLVGPDGQGGGDKERRSGAATKNVAGGQRGRGAREQVGKGAATKNVARERRSRGADAGARSKSAPATKGSASAGLLETKTRSRAGGSKTTAAKSTPSPAVKTGSTRSAPSSGSKASVRMAAGEGSASRSSSRGKGASKTSGAAKTAAKTPTSKAPAAGGSAKGRKAAKPGEAPRATRAAGARGSSGASGSKKAPTGQSAESGSASPKGKAGEPSAKVKTGSSAASVRSKSPADLQSAALRRRVGIGKARPPEPESKSGRKPAAGKTASKESRTATKGSAGGEAKSSRQATAGKGAASGKRGIPVRAPEPETKTGRKPAAGKTASKGTGPATKASTGAKTKSSATTKPGSKASPAKSAAPGATTPAAKTLRKPAASKASPAVDTTKPQSGGGTTTRRSKASASQPDSSQEESKARSGTKTRKKAQ